MSQSRVVCQHWSNHPLLLVWLRLLLWLGRLHTLRGHLALLLLLLGKLLQLYTQLFLLLLLEFVTNTRVGTLIVATIYLHLIQNRYTF